MAEDEPQACVLDHEGETLGRRGRIQRHVACPGTQDAQQGRQQGEIALEQQADPITCAHARHRERTRDSGAAGVERGIRQRSRGRFDGDGRRCAPGLRQHELFDARVAWILGRGRIPRIKQGAIVGAEQRQRTDFRGGGLGGAEQQGFETCHPARERGGIEEVGVVLAFQPHPADAQVDGVDEHLERFERPRIARELELHARHRGMFAGERLVDVEHHAHQRQAAAVAWQGQRTQQFAEGDCLVIVGIHQHAAAGIDQRVERECTGRTQAQRQHVHAMADQPFQPGGRLSGSRHADDDIFLARQAMQQCREARDQCREQAGALAGAQLAHLRHQSGGQHVVDAARALRAHGRSRSIGRKVQGRTAVLEQRGPPGQVARRAGGLRSAHARVVGERRGRLQRRVIAARGRELLDQHPERPAIQHDVVATQHQRVVAIGKSQQFGAQQGSIRKIERLGDVARRDRRELGAGIGRLREVEQRDVQGSDGIGYLQPQAVVGERRTQRIVPLRQRADRGPQPFRIERPAQMQRHRFVVGQRCLGAQPVGQPDLALRFGRRHATHAIAGIRLFARAHGEEAARDHLRRRVAIRLDDAVQVGVAVGRGQEAREVVEDVDAAIAQHHVEEVAVREILGEHVAPP